MPEEKITLEEKKTINVTSEETDYLWGTEQENIIKKWADKSLCFKMMHERAHRRFWCLNAWFNIPVIILSTVTGASNVATASFNNSAPYIAYIIGGVNIFAAILATIATYTGVAQKLEAHKYASDSFDKFARKLQIELAKGRRDRVKARDFLKQANEEYDRLIDMSPIIPNDVIRWFRNMIQTGEFEEHIGECATCCYECFCFPCGCSYCSCLNILCCNCDSKTEPSEEDKALKASWKLIELPEVVGRIKPTEVAKLPQPETPPPLIIVEKKQIEGQSKNVSECNEYDIYNINILDDSMV
jgi:hypothetical protein